MTAAEALARVREDVKVLALRKPAPSGTRGANWREGAVARILTALDSLEAEIELLRAVVEAARAIPSIRDSEPRTSHPAYSALRAALAALEETQ